MTQQMEKARLLLRVSNSDQQIENQRIALRSLCKQRGFTIDKEYEAKGVSAWTGEQRDLIDSVLHDARAGKFNYLVIWALDRMTREGIAATLDICDEFREAGVTIVSHQEPWIEQEGSFRELSISFVGWVAREESNRKSERNKASHVYMLAEDMWGRGKPPTGYRRGEDGKLEIDADHMETVRLIYTTYINNRIGVRGIKKELEKRGVRTRNGGTFWSPSSIEKILKDPTYKGRHSSGLSAPVIIDEERWQLAQDRRIANHNLKTGYTHKYALQGRATCECGGRIRVEHPARGRGQAVYFCNRRYANSYHVMKGGERCVVPRRRVDTVENELYREITACMNDPLKLIKMIEGSITVIEDELTSMSGDFSGVKTELDQVIEDIGRVEESWLRRRITTNRRDSLIGELEARRDSLESRLDDMSPERREILVEKQELLRGAKDYLKTLYARTEHEIPSWQFSLMPQVAESDALQKYRDSEYNAFPLDSNRIPEILEKVLTQFGMTAVFRQDRIDFIGGIELEIPDNDTHPYASIVGGS